MTSTLMASFFNSVELWRTVSKMRLCYLCNYSLLFKAQSGAFLVPRRLSLNVNLRGKEGGKEITFLLSPSLGPSRFVTSHSRFVLALLYTGFATCLNLLRSSSLPTYCARYLLAKSKTYSFGGASVKERKKESVGNSIV